MSISTKIEPGSINIRDDAWELVEVTEDFVRHRAPLERYPDGTVVYVQRTVPRGLTAMLEANKREFEDSHSKRFGGDKATLADKVASIPVNVLYDPKTQLAAKIKEGDRDHLKWWLNSDEAKPFRTFRGNI